MSSSSDHESISYCGLFTPVSGKRRKIPKSKHLHIEPYHLDDKVITDSKGRDIEHATTLEEKLENYYAQQQQVKEKQQEQQVVLAGPSSPELLQSPREKAMFADRTEQNQRKNKVEARGSAHGASSSSSSKRHTSSSHSSGLLRRVSSKLFSKPKSPSSSRSKLAFSTPPSAKPVPPLPTVNSSNPPSDLLPPAGIAFPQSIHRQQSLPNLHPAQNPFAAALAEVGLTATPSKTETEEEKKVRLAEEKQRLRQWIFPFPEKVLRERSKSLSSSLSALRVVNSSPLPPPPFSPAAATSNLSASVPTSSGFDSNYSTTSHSASNNPSIFDDSESENDCEDDYGSDFSISLWMDEEGQVEGTEKSEDEAYDTADEDLDLGLPVLTHGSTDEFSDEDSRTIQVADGSNSPADDAKLNELPIPPDTPIPPPDPPKLEMSIPSIQSDELSPLDTIRYSSASTIYAGQVQEAQPLAIDAALMSALLTPAQLLPSNQTPPLPPLPVTNLQQPLDPSPSTDSVQVTTDSGTTQTPEAEEAECHAL